ncbi:hypothetical protein HK101_004712 [Irineochytrium annulatum]|nr:hypothetical protein HK101_004712 [Irineochytrium annulatum]
MLPVEHLVPAIAGLIFDLVVIWVSWPLGGTLPIILLASALATTQINAVAFGFILPTISSSDFDASGDNGTSDYLQYTPAFAAACNTSAFIADAASLACYGAAAALAIELYNRTSSNTLKNFGLKKVLSLQRKWLYIVLAVLLPVIDIAILFPFKTGTGAHFLKGAYCDIDEPPIAFALIYVSVAVALTVTGSYFTIYAIVTYARRRHAILSLLADADNAATRANTTTTTTATANAATVTAAAMRTTGATTLARAVGSLNIADVQSQARSTADVLLHALRRMAFFTVIFHAIALYTVADEIVAVVQFWGKDRTGGGVGGDVGDAVTNMYIWLAASVGVFLCFGTGSHAMDRYRAVLWPLRRRLGADQAGKTAEIRLEDLDGSFRSINSSSSTLKVSGREHGYGDGITYRADVEV